MSKGGGTTMEEGKFNMWVEEGETVVVWFPWLCEFLDAYTALLKEG